METTPTTTNKRKPRRKRRVFLATLGLAALPALVYAYDTLTVSVPIMPAVGESAASACDADGVSTTYTYGATSNQGIKVSGANITGISESCTAGTLSFMNGTTAVATYSGTVATGALSLSTNVWTNDFTSVRVALFP